MNRNLPVKFIYIIDINVKPREDYVGNKCKTKIK